MMRSWACVSGGNRTRSQLQLTSMPTEIKAMRVLKAASLLYFWRPLAMSLFFTCVMKKKLRTASLAPIKILVIYYP